jgi:hypothetical protein
VFIDSHVPDAAGLVPELMQQRGGQGRFEIVMLDAEEDGVAQINKALADRAGLAAIHIISHVSAGQLQLGSGMVDAQTLSAAADSLGAWRAALSADADILLYGCDVASGPNGEAFLEMLAQLTGADVAGSVDLTGHPDFGGDWTLEARVGEVDSATIAGPQLSRMWRATLSEVPAETPAIAAAAAPVAGWPRRAPASRPVADRFGCRLRCGVAPNTAAVGGLHGDVVDRRACRAQPHFKGRR